MARERKFTMNELFRTAEELLLHHGYEGFTFSLLASRLRVSRGVIYRYFGNKDELIAEYMIFEMQHFLRELQKIEEQPDFEAQFEYLLQMIYKYRKIHQLMDILQQLRSSKKEKIKAKVQQLDTYHLDMYTHLQDFVRLGKEEGKLKAHLPDSLILGFIFQTIVIPNHYGVPLHQWHHSIKEILCSGMFAHPH